MLLARPEPPTGSTAEDVQAWKEYAEELEGQLDTLCETKDALLDGHEEIINGQGLPEDISKGSVLRAYRILEKAENERQARS